VSVRRNSEFKSNYRQKAADKSLNLKLARDGDIGLGEKIKSSEGKVLPWNSNLIYHGCPEYSEECPGKCHDEETRNLDVRQSH
jgi:hypothetical protein